MTPMLRPLGQTHIFVTPVAMGCWPISGITSIDVNDADSLATLQAALDAGINFFDTAYAYGYSGESEQLIARALGHRRREIVIASKCGIHWDSNRKQVRDALPDTIRRECDESLQRLKTDTIDLYYLHAPDPQVAVTESAGALKRLLEQGKIRAVGVSNFERIADYEAFHQVCPISVDQPHFNMLQREIEAQRLGWCLQHQVSVVPYWPLMKGFLAGKLSRNHVWDPKDGRQKYPLFQGDQWTRTHDFVDQLRVIATEAEMTVAQLVIAWTIQRPGITAALCGAKRPAQIIETAQAQHLTLNADQLHSIEAAIIARGEVLSRSALPQSR